MFWLGGVTSMWQVLIAFWGVLGGVLANMHPSRKSVLPKISISDYNLDMHQP